MDPLPPTHVKIFSRLPEPGAQGRLDAVNTEPEIGAVYFKSLFLFLFSYRRYQTIHLITQ